MLLATMAGRWYSLCVRDGLQKCQHALILIIGVFTIHSAVLSLEELLTYLREREVGSSFYFAIRHFLPLLYTKLAPKIGENNVSL